MSKMFLSNTTITPKALRSAPSGLNPKFNAKLSCVRISATTNSMRMNAEWDLFFMSKRQNIIKGIAQTIYCPENTVENSKNESKIIIIASDAS